MRKHERRLFCDISPTCFKISLQKEIFLRHIKNLLSRVKFAKTKETEPLPNVVFQYHSELIKRGKGIDPQLQENKATNIRLAGSKINHLIIRPGEVFSFWKTVGKVTRRKGYLDGRVIEGKTLTAGLGGGLCNLGNTIHYLVLHSPLEVVEFHNHSDALAPEHGERIPFSSGTSVRYNHVDYRFRNNTDQKVQLLVWCDQEKLYGELRSEAEFPWRYELLEEEHCFRKEGEQYFRHSKIYKLTRDRETNAILEKRLVLKNHSKVMYDYDQIPKELIQQ